MARRYKQQFRRKSDKLDPESIVSLMVDEQMRILRKAVDDAFKLKLDTRKLKRRKAA